MPRVDFQSSPTAEVKVSGRSVTDAPPITLPVGPRSFAPPPPPPPPPPIPIVFVDRDGANGKRLLVKWDEAVSVENLPNDIITDSDLAVNCTLVGTKTVGLNFGNTVGTTGTLHWPANSPAVRSLGGGSFVSAGDIVYPFPPL